MSEWLGRVAGWARRPGVKAALRAGVIALIVVIVGRSLVTGWGDIAGQRWHVAWPLLALGFLCLIGQELSYGVIWRAILRRQGYALPFLVSLRIYLAAEFVRYIPGNVWHVLARVRWAEARGIPKAQGLASMTVELATKIVAAALVFALSLLWWSDVGALGAGAGRAISLGVALVGAPLLMIGLRPRLLAYGLNRGLALLKRPPMTLALTYRDILLITLRWGGSWLIGGLGFWAVARAVAPGAWGWSSVPIAIGVYALGWDIGFLSFITPSGLGFREGAVALLLALARVVPDVTLAGLVAIIAARLAPTVAELLCVSAAYLAMRDRRTAARDGAPGDGVDDAAGEARATPLPVS